MIRVRSQLEYLEAEFYSFAAYGKGLPECAATTIGGVKANLSDSVQAYVEEIATNEAAHVKFLQTVSINVYMLFTMAYRSAAADKHGSMLCTVPLIIV